MRMQGGAVPAGCGVLAAVQGGAFAHERARSAEACAARAGVAGFALAGLGTGESREERAELLRAGAAPLPRRLPRFLLAGAGAPRLPPARAPKCSCPCGCLPLLPPLISFLHPHCWG